MSDDPTYTPLAVVPKTGREGMCNQCGVLVLDTDIYTQGHAELREAIRVLGIGRAFLPPGFNVITGGIDE